MRTQRFFTSVVDRLRSRSLIANITEKGVFPPKGSTFYIGFDPTAPSLHVGNLLGVLVATHLRQFGYKPILLVGGATGRVGDPSFREHPKNPLECDTLLNNTQLLSRQLTDLMESGLKHASKHMSIEEAPSVEVVDNYEWQSEIRLLDFLDTVGMHMRLSSMLGKESVQKRLTSEAGMSFTEFTYQLLQGYDYYHLYRTRDCRLQLGGSDQWGNMVSGLELISRLSPGNRIENVTVMTFPLLTTSSGEKMGKSAGNAIWLDPRMTSPFDLYQYFVRLPDADALRLLPMMTFIKEEAIIELKMEHQKNPENRIPQRILAEEVVGFVHGGEAIQESSRVSSLLFEEYDCIFKDPTEQQLVAKTLKQSNRHLSTNSTELASASILALLRRLLPDHSNSILLLHLYAFLICRQSSNIGHFWRYLY